MMQEYRVDSIVILKGITNIVKLFFVISLLIANTATADGIIKKITCFDAKYDHDGDGYASAGSKGVKKKRVFNRVNCPNGFVPAARDCNDNDKSVHPATLEKPFNNVDDNCNDQTDEVSFMYSENGYENSDSSFGIKALIHDRAIYDVFSESDKLYAKIEYQRLQDPVSVKKESDYKKVAIKAYADPEMGVYYAADFLLDGLEKTTVYVVRLKFFEKRDCNNCSGKHFRALSSYSDSDEYYTTTTDSTNRVSMARTKILLSGFKQLFNQKRGRVGKNGYKWINGTHYGAGKNNEWCSEFYSFNASHALDGIAKKSSVFGLKNYFRKNYYEVNKLSDLNGARRGDWLNMDDGKHTGMFLAKREDGTIITLEGNVGNRVATKERTEIGKIKGFGHIQEEYLR